MISPSCSSCVPHPRTPLHTVLLRQTRSIRSIRSSVAPLLAVAVAVLTIAASTARAQVSFAGVEAAIGRGAGQGGDYQDRSRLASRLGASLGLRVRPSLDVVLGADYELFDQLGVVIIPCIESPNPGCRPTYPQLAGTSATAGLRWAPDPRLHLTGRAGGGRYRTTAGTHEVTGALVLREDAAWRAFGPFWLVTSASHVRFADVRGDALHISAFSAGVRLR